MADLRAISTATLEMHYGAYSSLQQALHVVIRKWVVVVVVIIVFVFIYLIFYSWGKGRPQLTMISISEFKTS